MPRTPKELKAPAAEEQLEVLERFDPSEDAVTDGDPAFEAMLNPDSIPADKHAVWVHENPDPRQDGVRVYKGRRYYIPRAGEDGCPTLLSGLTFEKGEPLRYADHVLMLCDREVHEKRAERERQANEITRKRMLSKKNTTGDHFVEYKGADGPRPMQHRG